MARSSHSSTGMRTVCGFLAMVPSTVRTHPMLGPTEFSATATGGSPVEQLREALNGIFAQLRGAGGRATDFTAMTWRAAEPGAFDPSRSEIDLCYREVFGGFRPRVSIEPG